MTEEGECEDCLHRLCIACKEKERDILLLPCNHLTFCHECLKKAKTNAPEKRFRCPNCRGAVVAHLKVFL